MGMEGIGDREVTALGTRRGKGDRVGERIGIFNRDIITTLNGGGGDERGHKVVGEE